MQTKTVSDIGERGLIRIITEILGGLGNDILSGEDDAVAIQIKDPATLVINTDMLVSTTDVPPQMTLFQAARKAVVMTVSDVLVKGAVPKWAVVAIGVDNELPLEGKRGFKELIQGLKAGFDEYNVRYLGGDLNETKETIISCTIFGDAPYGVIPRSSAKLGDVIICTGELGNTGCGFSILLDKIEPNDLSKEHKMQFMDSVLHPKSPTDFGLVLQENDWVTASCDSSDGILSTIKEICKSSNVGAELGWKSLPIASGVEDYCEKSEKNIIDIVFNTGEEFVHLFTIPKSKLKEAQDHLNDLGLKYYTIGVITENKEIILKFDNENIILTEKSGYEHFRKKNR